MILEHKNENSKKDDVTAYDPKVSGSLHAETRGDRLCIFGDVDLYVAVAFRQAGEAHVRESASPFIDLTGVAFLDSAGLAALLSIARVARSCDRRLRIAAVGNPRRVLRITGVDRLVSIED